MLTQKDIKKIKESLKDDFDGLSKSIQRVEKKVDTVSENIDDLSGAVGAIFEWTDDIHRAIVGRKHSKTSGN